MLKPKPEDKLRRQGLPSTLSLRRVNPCQGHLGKDRRQDSLSRLGVRGSTVMHACGHSAVAFSAASGRLRCFPSQGFGVKHGECCYLHIFLGMSL